MGKIPLILGGVVLITLFGYGLVEFGLVGLKYPVVVDNEPLENPVRVKSILADDLLVLSDGRKVRLRHKVRNLRKLLDDSNWQVDIEPLDEASNDTLSAEVYVRQAGWVCGTPYAKLIVIPLIPVRHERWWRSPLE